MQFLVFFATNAQFLTQQRIKFFFFPSNSQTEVDGVNKEQEARRRQILRNKHQRSQRGVIGTPPPVKGRRHETIQTEKYLEEFLTRPIESDAQCQTDLFLHRPPTPPQILSSIKLINVETQVLDGELFDFDAEVEPLLEMMVGRTVEQSLLEVLNEEEFSDLRKQQQEFLTIREAEIADLKRLQNKEFTPKDDKVCFTVHCVNYVCLIDRILYSDVNFIKISVVEKNLWKCKIKSQLPNYFRAMWQIVYRVFYK